MVRAQSLDRETLVDRELTLAQGDHVALETLGELNCVAGVGRGDHSSQRAAGTIVKRACDREFAWYRAIFEYFQGWLDARPKRPAPRGVTPPGIGMGVSIYGFE